MSTLSKQAAFGVYSPAAIGWGGHNDPMKYPELLTKFVHSGVSFGSMHKYVVPIFTDLLDRLVPLIPGGLVAGTCGCYNPGSVTVGGDRSFHTYAIAIDVNWAANPMYTKKRPTGKHALPAKTSGIAHGMGCEWGGDWSYPQDWMHLEVHLSPEECRAYARTRKPAVVAPSDPLEEIMAYYKNRADFEASMRRLIQAEIAETPVTVAHLWDEAPKPVARRMPDILSRALARHDAPKPGA